MSLGKDEATEQILNEFKKAGIECSPEDQNSIEKLTQQIIDLGNEDKDHGMMSGFSAVAIHKILTDNSELVGQHAIKVCEILENTAPNPEAKQVLQETFVETKARHSSLLENKILKESLDIVQETVTELSKNNDIRRDMGDDNADKFA